LIPVGPKVIEEIVEDLSRLVSLHLIVYSDWFTFS